MFIKTERHASGYIVGVHFLVVLIKNLEWIVKANWSQFSQPETTSCSVFLFEGNIQMLCVSTVFNLMRSLYRK